MGKVVKISCVSCGHTWENRIGCGLLHGNLGNVMKVFSGEEQEISQIRQYAAQNAYPVFDFAYRLACCNHCGNIVSVPVLNLADGAGDYIGSCVQCGRKIEWTDIIKKTEEAPCPICGVVSLQEEETGMWD